MDAIVELCPDPIEPEEEEDCVGVEAMFGSRETERKWEREEKIQTLNESSDTKIEKLKLKTLLSIIKVTREREI